MAVCLPGPETLPIPGDLQIPRTTVGRTVAELLVKPVEYGSGFSPTVTILTADVTADEGRISVASAIFQEGDIIRIDDEYMIVEADCNLVDMQVKRNRIPSTS